MTAHATGLPSPRVLCYTDHGTIKGGWILMTRIPGEALWDSHQSYSDEELTNILAGVGTWSHRIPGFASPYGTAVCGSNGGRIYTRAMPKETWRRRESPEDIYDDMLICTWNMKDSDRFKKEYAEACKLKDKSYRVVFGHGDLHFSNIMVQDGRLTGIIDWGSAGWYPEYWDFAHPMSTWCDEWGWAVDFLYDMPGGEKYEQERKSFDAIIQLSCGQFF